MRFFLVLLSSQAGFGFIMRRWAAEQLGGKPDGERREGSIDQYPLKRDIVVSIGDSKIYF